MKILLLLLLLPTSVLFSQKLTGPKLLEKSIRYHDPKGNWESFKGTLHLTETRPDGPDRTSTVLLDNGASFFRIDQTKDGETTIRVVDKGECHHALKGVEELTYEQVEKHRLTCDRTTVLRNYYTYLWGLPMKLNDPGTLIQDEVKATEFQGKACLALKVTYDEAVGKDTWYFYFHPKTYALIGYEFYHNEGLNDGEYVTLTDEVALNGILIPKERKWFVTKGDEFLGADILDK